MRHIVPLFISLWIFLSAGSVMATEESAPEARTPGEKTSVSGLVASQVRVDGAYVNVPVPGAKNTAAFFTLRNLSGKSVSLVSVAVDGVGRAELHSHTTKDGMMQMRKEEKITVPAKSSVAFASGSYHVMLFDMQRSIRTGEELQLLLTFADGTHVVATAKVKSIFDDAYHH